MGLGQWRAAVFVLFLAAAACQPAVKDLEVGETGQVSDVQDGDTLTLDSGLKTHLAGVEAPALRGPQGREARQALESLTLGRAVTLHYGGAKRYVSKRTQEEAALAHVFVKTEGGRTIWVQEALVMQGMARVHSRKDNFARSDRLLAAEAAARSAKRGLWADPAFAIRPAEGAPAPALAALTEEGSAAPEDAPEEAAPTPAFQIYEGRIRSVQATERRTYLNFGDDPMSDFTVAIDAEALAAWPDPTKTPEALSGARVRVRGYVSDRGGPLMRIDHPAAIEVLTKGG